MKPILFLLTAFILLSCGSKTQSQSSSPNVTLHVLPGIISEHVEDTLAKGAFVDTDAHHLSGYAYLYRDVKDSIVLRIENLSVLGGPDVDVFLSDSNGYANVIRLGHLEGKDGQPVRGTLAYELNHDIDFKKYNHVIFWCKRYSVLFGYAELN